jgi:tetratricopeptide (TPR) repeat protein
MSAAWTVLALGLILAPLATCAEEAPPLTREQALARIATGDVEIRRQAVARLGDVGTMPDVPALTRALSDPDEVTRGLAEQSVWQVWSRSGDPAIDALFQLGLAQLNQGDPEAAIETFTTIIDKKPDFAEGWNKRATIFFLVGEYQKSLRDCDEVLKRNPTHWGVLAGYGQIYLQLDQPERALGYFQRALAINPNLRQVEAAVEQLKRLIADKRRDTI